MQKTILLIILIFLTACEDQVTVDFGESANMIAVDGIITNLKEDQTVIIQRTGSYFSEGDIPYINDAKVWVESSDGKTYDFAFSDNGRYILPGDEVDFQMGIDYNFYIEFGSNTFSTSNNLKRVPEIDSISWKMESVEPFGIDVDSIIYAQFYARDIDGVGDRFWARGYKNDSLINQDGFNLAWDASPGPGIIFDGDTLSFAQPIRQVVTPNGTEFGEIIEVGDTLKVKLLAISEDLVRFITILSAQIDNQGLFATPPANVPTNLINLNPNGEKILGWFEICNTSTDSAVVKSNVGNNRLE